MNYKDLCLRLLDLCDDAFGIDETVTYLLQFGVPIDMIEEFGYDLITIYRQQQKLGLN